jgi:glycerate kinase
VRAAAPEAQIATIPVADGGEGTAEALAAATGGRMVHVTARDPMGRPVDAAFALLGDGRTAVVEMARASGLTLVGDKDRDALKASTEGTGDLIAAALSKGAERVVVGIGGSATTDGGTGMARALGVRFLDREGRDLTAGGGPLAGVERIDTSGLDARVTGTEFIVACDVDNPLVGPSGTATVYAPQKGAAPADVQTLEAAMRHYAAVLERDLGVGVADLPGGGAAGGLGAGLVAFTGATLRSGIDIVLDIVGFDAALAGADLVITAEGRLDAQTARGKAPAGVARRARAAGVSVVALAGILAPDARTVREVGVDAYFAIAPGPIDQAASIQTAAERLAATAEEVVRLVDTVTGRCRGADT